MIESLLQLRNPCRGFLCRVANIVTNYTYIAKFRIANFLNYLIRPTSDLVDSAKSACRQYVNVTGSLLIHVKILFTFDPAPRLFGDFPNVADLSKGLS